MISSMFVSLGTLTLYPLLMIMKVVGLNKSLWGVIIIRVFGMNVTNLFIARGYINTIPEEIDEAARKVIRDAGYGEWFGHGFGHSLGLEIHEAPACNPREKRLMPEGAVVSAEPGIYLPGKFGVRIEDVMILHPDGAEVITQAEKSELKIVGSC